MTDDLLLLRMKAELSKEGLYEMLDVVKQTVQKADGRLFELRIVVKEEAGGK